MFASVLFSVTFNARRGLALLMVFAASMLTACGGGGSSTPDTPTPPVISVQSNPVSAVAGDSATFSITATGVGLSFQWQLRITSAATWTNIAGATSATYVIAVVDASMNGNQYQAVITGPGGSVTSTPATLTVSPAAAPTISVQPSNQSVTAPATTTFAVTASGAPTPTYQWQVSSNSGVSFANIVGATSNSYITPATVIADNAKQFRVVVTNRVNSVTSNVATLSVAPDPTLPIITTQPVAVGVVAPQAATFSVVATVGTGNSAITYQWQQSTDGISFANITSATATSYTTPATTLADSTKQFRVVVTSGAKSATSNAAVLTVVTAGSAPVITGSPADQIAYTTVNDFGAQRTATFTTAVSGNLTPTYQWQMSTDSGTTFTNINGATSLAYTTPTVVASDNNAQFRIVATNALGIASSHPAKLVTANIGIGGIPSGLAIALNGDIYSASWTGDPLSTSSNGVFMGVRVVHASGAVTTLAGSRYASGDVDVDGTGAAAKFLAPHDVALDLAGNAYVPDSGNRIRKIAPSGVVTTLAGGDAQGGFVNGNGALASFNTPIAVVLDSAGNVYVADQRNYAIRKVSPAGDVTTLAGGHTGSADGVGAAAQFGNLQALAIDASGNLYVAEQCAIRKVTPAGAVTTYAGGTGLCGQVVDGPLATAQFKTISSTAVDSAGDVYVSDQGAMRKITAAGVVSTLPGSFGRVLSSPVIALDSSDNLYAAYLSAFQFNGFNVYSFLVQKVTPSGVVTFLP